MTASGAVCIGESERGGIGIVIGDDNGLGFDAPMCYSATPSSSLKKASRGASLSAVDVISASSRTFKLNTTKSRSVVLVRVPTKNLSPLELIYLFPTPNEFLIVRICSIK